MAYKRILTIQDISCVGQCSMTVAMPILSACGHETCILPTAILSTHTGGFGKPVVHKITADMDAVWQHWHSQGITFDAILVGYLGSVEAIGCAGRIAEHLLAPGGVLIVDPAMGDHGKLYSGFDETYAAAMKQLCFRADIMMPNLTEAAMMTGMPWKESWSEGDIRELLNALGGKNVVLTGVGFQPEQTGAAVRFEGKISFYHHERLPKNYHGTGDMFAACFTGALMQGKHMLQAVEIASEFTCRSIRATYENPAHWYGVKFETVLPWLADILQ